MFNYLFGFGILCLLGFFSLVFANEEIAVVVKLSGDVRVTPANSSKGDRIKKGQILKDGDKLETGPASYCALKFLDDKSLLRIKEKSSCIIEGKRQQNTIKKNIFVELGSFFLSLFEQNKNLKVTTPTSVASVKGTKFWVFHKIETRYVCTEGAIEVESNAGKALVRKGQTGIVVARSRMPEVRLTREGDIPLDEADAGLIRFLDFEFSNSSGDIRVLRVRIKSQD
jgi:hypothetical protein